MVLKAMPSDLDWVKPMIDRHKDVFGFVPRPVFTKAIEEGELLIVPHVAFCRFHVRRDGVCVIYEILSEQKGCGKCLLEKLPRPVLAKCPEGLPSNGFYQKQGFRLERIEDGKKRRLHVWVLD